ncbi:MAG: tetraacyldisaccharide 4'-kinase [Herminiimonas sp.]|nr:tetraacyldisaccharide 4'-kinase [Herminiimonas sp.]
MPAAFPAAPPVLAQTDIRLSFKLPILATILTRTWTARGPLACALWPLSMLFGGLSWVRRLMYRHGLLASVRLPVPVIIVGNIFIGGTGKTPLTIWLVQSLREAGRVPGVISRGHGGSQAAPRSVHLDSLPGDVGDEPLLIAQRARCPVVVGHGRVDAARLLLAANPEVDVIVSDDGLQHYALQRDIEIILFDARRVGNGWLLPAGPLREPASRRRDFTVVNIDPMTEGVPRGALTMRLGGTHAEALANRSKSMPLEMFAVSAPRIVAAAGIGNPARFFAMLRTFGLMFAEVPLPDHYDFGINPFAALDAEVILITEKDAVKCSRIDMIRHDPRLWVVPVTAQIDAALATNIVEKLRGHPTA